MARSEKQRANKRGFTLIELLVVITIIAILATIGIAAFTRAQARGRDSRRQGDLASLRNALELYYSENSAYINTNNIWRSVNETYLGALTPDFTKTLSSDPGGAGREYRYRSVSGTQAYCLEAALETASGTQSTCTINLQSGYNYGVGNP